MLVIIVIIMILTIQCAGGAFVCFHPLCYMSQCSSSLFLYHSSFHLSNKMARYIEDCPWLTPTINGSMGCNDGSTCDTPWFSCCSERGGRAKCPLSRPLMCAKPNDCADGSDYCCDTNCDASGGIRQCGELIFGDTPCILETEFESKVWICFCMFLAGRIEIEVISTFCLLNFLTYFQSQCTHINAPGPWRHPVGGRSSVCSNCAGFTSLVRTQKFHNPH
jgi:hypothetical protein